MLRKYRLLNLGVAIRVLLLGRQVSNLHLAAQCLRLVRLGLVWLLVEKSHVDWMLLRVLMVGNHDPNQQSRSRSSQG